jgi:hypothetical protein
MENEKLQINLAPGMDKAEIIIREVGSVNELTVKPPIKLAISGVITAPTEFLKQRLSEKDQIDPKRCHILVDREQISIVLVFNENDEYNTGSIKGILSLHPKFIEFGINSGKVWAPIELGMFLKMNRAFFPDKTVNMNLVTELMNFTATVNNSIDRSAKENGDRTDKFAQTVNSNLPKAFTLIIPIFKGKPAETLEVETFANVNGREVSFVLLSPAANQTMEEIRDKVIDEQIDVIRLLAPDIAIIEK